MREQKQSWLGIGCLLAVAGCAPAPGGPSWDSASGGKGDGERALSDAEFYKEELFPQQNVIKRMFWDPEGAPDNQRGKLGFMVNAGRGATLKFRYTAWEERGNRNRPLDVSGFVYAKTEDGYENYFFESDGYDGANHRDDEFSGNRFEGEAEVSDNVVTLPAMTVTEAGEQRILLISNPGASDRRFLEIEVICEGSASQCREPIESQCEEGTAMVRGSITEDTTWTKCDTILLESTVVEEGVTLAIEPGVRVRGNFLGEEPYGNVDLTVRGTLHAEGTEDDPIFFEARYGDVGWGGLTLDDTSKDNRLKNVVFGNARTAFTIRSADEGNTLEKLQISQSENGVAIEGGAINIINSTIVGIKTDDGTREGIGIRSTGSEAISRFERAYVANFDTGIQLADTQFAITDATIVDNRRGVHITGEETGTQPAACPNFPFNPPAPRWTGGGGWYRDPIFLHTDIARNEEIGVLIDSPQFVQIRKSNIVDNGSFGVQVDAQVIRNLNEEEAEALAEILAGVGLELGDENSHVKGNNIIRNNVAGLPEHCDGWGQPGDEATGSSAPCVTAQVDLRHVDGSLDMTGNWWGFTSDRGGALAGAYRASHDGFECRTEQRPRNASCQWRTRATPDGDNGRKLLCGVWDCGWQNDPAFQTEFGHNQLCTATVDQSWQSEVDTTGFAYMKILDAGPRDLAPPVTDKRDEVQIPTPLVESFPEGYPED